MDKNRPIFYYIFGKQWESLPLVMRKHYANRPYSKDITAVEGEMDVVFNKAIKILAPLLKILGVLIPCQGVSIPTTVRFKSDLKSRAFSLDRECRFKKEESIHFCSKMVPQGGNEVIEYVRLGVGWRFVYACEGDKVKLLHRGYVWRVLGINVPVPLTILLGKGEAEEQALSDTEFIMRMAITHSLWGEVYAYRGIFKIVDI